MAEWNGIPLEDWEYELPDGVEPEYTERVYRACWLPRKYYDLRPLNQYMTRIYPREFVKSLSDQYGTRWHKIPKGEVVQIYPDLFIDAGGQARNGYGVLVKGTRSSASVPWVRKAAGDKVLELTGLSEKITDVVDLRKYLTEIRGKVKPEKYARDFAEMYQVAIQKGDVKSFLALSKILGIQFGASKIEDLEKPDEVASLESLIRIKQAELEASKLDDELLKRATTVNGKLIDVEEYDEEGDYDDNEYFPAQEEDWGAVWLQKQRL